LPHYQVDGQTVVFVFVGEFAPQRVVRSQLADGLEGQLLQAPRAEFVMLVGAVFDVDLHAVAELAGVLMEGWLEPTLVPLVLIFRRVEAGSQYQPCRFFRVISLSAAIQSSRSFRHGM